MENIKVECYSGYRGEQTPLRFWLGDCKVEVRRTLDSWLAPDHRYFKVLGDDGGLYILRHDPYHHRWEITFYRKTSPADGVDGSC